MIVVHFDVIASPSERFITRTPSPEGRRLWNTFFEMYKGRIILLADEDTDSNLMKEWLKRENFKPSLIHIADGMHLSSHTSRSGAVWWANSNIGKITWYLDVDPACCADALRMGIPTLLVAVPTVIRPEWSERPQMRAWDAVVGELEAQAIKRSEKNWGDD